MKPLQSSDKYAFAVDGGTTNTRVYLLNGGKIVCCEKFSSRPEGMTQAEAVEQAAGKILKQKALQERDISVMLFSGVIGSEQGICTIPHTDGPVGLAELHSAMVRKQVLHLDIPQCFIPGVRFRTGILAESDMMRGEECEIFGLCDRPQADTVYVLFGSHSKWIYADEQGRISGCKTMLTGEMLAALSANTVLRNAFDARACSLQEDELLNGYDYCGEHGLNDALFKVRVMKIQYERADSDAYSFFLGAVLGEELRMLLKRKESHIILSGRDQIKNAARVILKNRSDREVTVISEEVSSECTPRGVWRVYEYGAAE